VTGIDADINLNKLGVARARISPQGFSEYHLCNSFSFNGEAKADEQRQRKRKVPACLASYSVVDRQPWSALSLAAISLHARS
jgi:hypothetical protein